MVVTPGDQSAHQIYQQNSSTIGILAEKEVHRAAQPVWAARTVVAGGEGSERERVVGLKCSIWLHSAIRSKGTWTVLSTAPCMRSIASSRLYMA